MPPRARTPTPDEAALLTIYLDAERYLLGSVSQEVADLADVADAGGDTDAQRVKGMRRVRAAAESVVRGLERGAPARIEAVIGAGADAGVDEAVAQLTAVTGGAGGIADYGDTINRGALDRLAATVVAKASDVHLSILRTVPDAYRDAVARTVSGVLVGSQTRREAAQRALWSLTDRGITSFVDKGGRRWKLSSYVEMATRTAAARAHTDAQLDRLGADGHDYVRVSDAPRECPRCAKWEGEILARTVGIATGRVQIEHAIEDGVMVTVDVAATVEEARLDGLFHPNCRHSLSLYLPGVTAPLVVKREPEKYHAGQQQRDIERNIRAWKSRRTAAIDEPSRKWADQHIRAWNERMARHLDEHPDLKRLPYREAPGAGNLPTDSTRGKVGAGGPTPTLVEGKERAPRQMVDAELDRKMRESLVREDMDAFDLLAAETDRRDDARQAAADRRAEQREAREEAKAAEFDRLMSAGSDEESAVADAYGIPVEKQRRQRAMSDLRRDGYEGKGFDDLARASFEDHLVQRIQDAEDATNGYMLNNAAEARGINPRSLFIGPERNVRAHASDELREWFDRNGRPTLAEWKAELLGEGGAARAMRNGRGDFLA